ncbi:MAG: FG-GAP repeat protein [Deltaproteobacteria bacterium]|nr:FG-GAP repeat protein [Deltaproteobacteria bacterium]
MPQVRGHVEARGDDHRAASNHQSDDSFGCSISLVGDTLAIGADGEDSGATGVDGDETDESASRSGAVYIFTRTGTVWNAIAFRSQEVASRWGRPEAAAPPISSANDSLSSFAPRSEPIVFLGLWVCVCLSVFAMGGGPKAVTGSC